MITYIDSSNKQDYTVLFDKASAKLGLTPIVKEVVDENGDISYEYYRRIQKDGVWTEVKLGKDDLDDNGNLIVNGKVSKGISSLNEYFQHITDLASLAIGNGRTGSDPYFLRLPLNEPFLEINANTRAITVPASLKQIGVRGDKFAEIVFFKIDRYYDAVDLDTRHIYIEWELPDGTKGISRDFLRDTQSEKDKIIFGWVIGDELTKQVGNIRFAVRFVEWTHDKDASSDAATSGTSLAYSFSSLPAQITIVDSLDYSLFEDSAEEQMIDTLGQASTLKFYFEDSAADGTDETAPELADKPVYLRNLSGTLVSDKVYAQDLDDQNQLELAVEAYSPDSGSISYMFARKDDLNSGSKGLVAQIKFSPIELTSSTIDKNTIYYTKKANDTFAVISQDDIKKELETEDKVTCYERIAYIIVGGPGYYFAQARNRVSGKKATSENSNIVYVAKASAPVISKRMPESFVIKKKEYSLAYDPTIDQTLRENAFKDNIVINASETTGPATISLGTSVNGPTITAEKTRGLTYTWYKATKADLSDAQVIEDAKNSIYSVTEPGYYAVAVDNYYNNSHEAIDKAASGVIRVTNMPVLSKDLVHFADWEKTLSTGAVTSIAIDEVEHDHITYEWHKVTPAADMDPVALGDMNDAAGEVEFTNGKGTIPFKPLHAGAYYFILKNELNGASIYFDSALDFGVIVVTANENPNTGSTISVASVDEMANALASSAISTIRLSADTEVTQSLPVPQDKTVTFDLNGQKLYVDKMSTIVAPKGSTLIFKNGTVTSAGGDTPITARGEGARVVIDGATVENLKGNALEATQGGTVVVNSGTVHASGGAVFPFNNGNVEINGGELISDDNAAILSSNESDYAGYNVTINRGDIVGNVKTDGQVACGVYSANRGTITINGGSVTANHGAGIVARGGTIEINGGTIIANGDPGKTGKVGATGGVPENAAIVYDSKAGYPDASGLAITIGKNAVISGDIVRLVADGETAHITDNR